MAHGRQHDSAPMRRRRLRLLVIIGWPADTLLRASHLVAPRWDAIALWGGAMFTMALAVSLLVLIRDHERDAERLAAWQAQISAALETAFRSAGAEIPPGLGEGPLAPVVPLHGPRPGVRNRGHGA